MGWVGWGELHTLIRVGIDLTVFTYFANFGLLALLNLQQFANKSCQHHETLLLAQEAAVKDTQEDDAKDLQPSQPAYFSFSLFYYLISVLSFLKD